MNELNTIYKFLIEHQLTSSQEHFSKYWLHKSPRYYATIKSSKRNASVEALSTLMTKLYGLGSELQENRNQNSSLLWHTAMQFADKLRETISNTSISREPHKRMAPTKEQPSAYAELVKALIKRGLRSAA